MADKDISTGSCCPHHDVDDGQGPQDVIPKSKSFDEILDENYWEEEGDDEDDDNDGDDQHSDQYEADDDDDEMTFARQCKPPSSPAPSQGRCPSWYFSDLIITILISFSKFDKPVCWIWS